MKKSIAITFGLLASSVFAQTPPVTIMSTKDICPPVKEVKQTCATPEVEKPKVKVKKPVIKKTVLTTTKKDDTSVKKDTKKEQSVVKVENIPEKSSLLEAQYYHIPSYIKDEDIAKFNPNISYSDIKTTFVQEGGSVNIKIMDTRTNQPLDYFYLDTDVNDKVLINSLTVNSDLSDAISSKQDYSNNGFNVKYNDQGKCEIILFSYKLKNMNDPKTDRLFLNKNGKIVNELTDSCIAFNLDSKDTTFYTKSGNIVNIGLNQKSISNGEVGFTMHISKEGKEYFPSKLSSFAITRDFSAYYPIESNYDKRSPFFGISGSVSVPKNDYYVLIGFENDNKFEWVKSTISLH